MLPASSPPPAPRCNCYQHMLAASGQWFSIYPPMPCPVHEPVREALGRLLRSRREDPAFRDRIRASIEENREILDRLTTGH